MKYFEACFTPALIYGIEGWNEGNWDNIKKDFKKNL